MIRLELMEDLHGRGGIGGQSLQQSEIPFRVEFLKNRLRSGRVPRQSFQNLCLPRSKKLLEKRFGSGGIACQQRMQILLVGQGLQDTGRDALVGRQGFAQCRQFKCGQTLGCLFGKLPVLPQDRQAFIPLPEALQNLFQTGQIHRLKTQQCLRYLTLFLQQTLEKILRQGRVGRQRHGDFIAPLLQKMPLEIRAQHRVGGQDPVDSRLPATQKLFDGIRIQDLPNRHCLGNRYPLPPSQSELESGELQQCFQQLRLVGIANQAQQCHRRMEGIPLVDIQIQKALHQSDQNSPVPIALHQLLPLPAVEPQQTEEKVVRQVFVAQQTQETFRIVSQFQSHQHLIGVQIPAHDPLQLFQAVVGDPIRIGLLTHKLFGHPQPPPLQDRYRGGGILPGKAQAPPLEEISDLLLGKIVRFTHQHYFTGTAALQQRFEGGTGHGGAPF